MGKIDLRGGTISYNVAEESGGGVYTATKTSNIALSGTTIQNNTAPTGAGIYAQGTFLMEGGTVAKNIGDGVYFENPRWIFIEGGEITENEGDGICFAEGSQAKGFTIGKEGEVCTIKIHGNEGKDIASFDAVLVGNLSKESNIVYEDTTETFLTLADGFVPSATTLGKIHLRGADMGYRAKLSDGKNLVWPEGEYQIYQQTGLRDMIRYSLVFSFRKQADQDNFQNNLSVIFDGKIKGEIKEFEGLYGVWFDIIMSPKRLADTVTVKYKGEKLYVDGKEKEFTLLQYLKSLNGTVANDVAQSIIYYGSAAQEQFSGLSGEALAAPDYVSALSGVTIPSGAQVVPYNKTGTPIFASAEVFIDSQIYIHLTLSGMTSAYKLVEKTADGGFTELKVYDTIPGTPLQTIYKLVIPASELSAKKNFAVVSANDFTQEHSTLTYGVGTFIQNMYASSDKQPLLQSVYYYSQTVDAYVKSQSGTTELPPVLKLEGNETQFKDLSEEDSAAIWDYAHELVEAWNKEYQAILGTQDITPETITRNEADFSIEIISDSQRIFVVNEDGSIVAKENANFPKIRKTRTTATLSNWANSQYNSTNNTGATYTIDNYGGWENHPYGTIEKTGHFYVKQLRGRWFFITPEGNPLIVRSVMAPLMSYNNNPDQLEAALKKGNGTAEGWAAKVTEELNDLGFTSTTPSDNAAELDAVATNRLSYQTSVDVITTYGKEIGVCYKAGSTLFDENISDAIKADIYDNAMPVFDLGFEEAVDRILRDGLAGIDIDDAYLLGITTDNELPMNNNLLDRYLGISETATDNISPDKSTSRYSYAAAWTWLRYMLNDDTLSPETLTTEGLNALTNIDELRELFRGFVYWRYFSVVEPAFEKYAPDTLYFGTRFLNGATETSVSNAEWVVRFAGKYADVININLYHVWTLDDPFNRLNNNTGFNTSDDDMSERLTVWSGNKPFQVSEFYARCDDVNEDGKIDQGELQFSANGAGWCVATQEQRGQFYENFTLSLLEWKNNIGWHWYRYNHYYKNEGKTPDSSGGIVDNEHNYYEGLATAFENINNNVYGLIQFFDNVYP